MKKACRRLVILMQLQNIILLFIIIDPAHNNELNYIYKQELNCIIIIIIVILSKYLNFTFFNSQ
jgi:hypothetical protein